MVFCNRSKAVVRCMSFLMFRLAEMLVTFPFPLFLRFLLKSVRRGPAPRPSGHGLPTRLSYLCLGCRESFTLPLMLAQDAKNGLWLDTTHGTPPTFGQSDQATWLVSPFPTKSSSLVGPGKPTIRRPGHPFPSARSDCGIADPLDVLDKGSDSSLPTPLYVYGMEGQQFG